MFGGFKLSRLLLFDVVLVMVHFMNIKLTGATHANYEFYHNFLLWNIISRFYYKNNFLKISIFTFGS